MDKPTNEWVDNYIDTHPDSCIEDAERAWWDEQIDKGEDLGGLTAEQEAVSKELRKGHAVDAYDKERKRERKENPDKRLLVQAMANCFGADNSPCEAVEVVNPERQVDFVLNGVHYSATLTAHRTPKG